MLEGTFLFANQNPNNGHLPYVLYGSLKQPLLSPHPRLDIRNLFALRSIASFTYFKVEPQNKGNTYLRRLYDAPIKLHNPPSTRTVLVVLDRYVVLTRIEWKRLFSQLLRRSKVESAYFSRLE
jgi:hypothetical protein